MPHVPRELGVDVMRLPLLEMNVVVGEQVAVVEVLARIDPVSLERAVDQASANLLSAEASLVLAKNPYTALDKKRAELSVAQAETALEEAREGLRDIQDPDVGKAEEVVEDAVRDLKQAQDDPATLKKDPATQEQVDFLQWIYNQALVAHGDFAAKNDASELGQDRLAVAYNEMMDAKDALESARLQAELSLLTAENQVAEAQDALSDAREKLDEQQAGATALELAQANDQVAQAEYNLSRAQEERAAIEAGPEEEAIQGAQASYAAALAALVEAEAALASATILAPFDGTVVSVGAEAGSLVSAGTAIVTMADLTELRVQAAIYETEISQVQVGQDVEITFDAFTGQVFQGKVLEVPLQGTVSENLVTYAVPVSLEGAEGINLKPGMTANLTIITGRSQNALLIPVLAVQQGDSGSVVRVQNKDGTTFDTPVQIGLGNGTHVEVLRGLNEGDQVVVTYDTSDDEMWFGYGPEFAGEGPPPDMVIPAEKMP